MASLKNFGFLIVLFLNSNLMFSQVLVGGIIEGLGEDHLSGYSVDMSSSGNRIAIGAIGDDILPNFGGYVRIMDFDGSMWNQTGSLIEGINDDDQAGTCVAISGNGEIVAVGAPRYSGIGNSFGHIRVFQWNGNDWSQLGQDIDGDFIFDEFGRAIDLNENGSRMVIGNFQSDPNGFQSGLARTYEWTGTNWEQLGQTIDGMSEGDRTGEAVAINGSGNRIAVGSPRSNINGEASGVVRMYEYNGNDWIQLGQDIEGEGEINFSGQSIGLNTQGNRVLIGETQNNESGDQAGQARVFMYDGSIWNQMGSDLNGEAAFDLFGFSTSMNADGNVIAVGSYFNDGNGSAAGHARIFQWSGNDWIQIGGDIDGTQIGDASAYSLSLNAVGDKVVIGSPFNDDNGEDSGHVRVFLNDNLNSEDWNLTPEIEVVMDIPTGLLKINSDQISMASIQVYSMEGKRIKSYELNNPKQYIEMEFLGVSEGVYLLEIVDVIGETYFSRFLKH